MNAPDRTEFLARRRSGIGGSDIAAILGLSPYKTPLQVWREKTGRADDEIRDADAIERMHWGTVLEDAVARHYAKQRGVRVQRINQLLRHPRCEIAIANIDRVVIEDGSRARWDDSAARVIGARNVLECKTAHALAIKGFEWGAPGTDEVPQGYWLQCQWYLAITGLPFADLAVLFGGQKFVTYTITRDRIVDDLVDEAAGWWRAHVEADTPPDPRSEDEARSLWRSHVAGRDRIVEASVATAVRDLLQTKAEISALEQREQQLRDLILPSFGNAESISHQGQRLATWKANKSSSKTDWKTAFLNLCADGRVCAAPEVIAACREHEAINTTTIEGARVLRLAIKE